MPIEVRQLGVMIDEVAAVLSRYMAMSDDQIVACSLWVVHTYAVDGSDFTPYLHVHSPERECGKTTLLDVLQALAREGRTCDGMSPAALYRIVDRDAPTLLLDELDTVFGAGAKTERSEALRGVLNSGFRRGGSFVVCSGESHDPREFSTFCPKVLAGIGELPDTLASRSLPIRLERASGDALANLKRLRGDRVRDELADLRDSLTAWASATVPALREADPLVSATLSARKADVCRPLLAIAEAAGGHWPERARAALVALCASTATDDQGSLGSQLLADLAGVFLAHGRAAGEIVAWLSSADLARELNELEGHPWPDFNRGQPITTNQIARLLKRYGVRPRNKRDRSDDRPRVLKGYFWNDMEAPVRRYAPAALLPRSLTPSGAATVATAATEARGGITDEDVQRGAISERAPSSGGLAAVPPQEPPGSGVAAEAAPGGSDGEPVEASSDGVRRHSDGSTEFTPERIAALRAARRLLESGRW